MARILTGIQSTGSPHLGNILGAVVPAIELSLDSDNESFFFIADLHSFTTIRDADELKNNTYATAAAWLAFGFNTKKNLFYRLLGVGLDIREEKRQSLRLCGGIGKSV